MTRHPKPIERQRRLIREELRDHARDIGYTAKSLPGLIAKQEWTPQRAAELGTLVLYSVGLALVGFAVLAAMYIEAIEA